VGGSEQSAFGLQNYVLSLYSKKTKFSCNTEQKSLFANVCLISLAISISACNNLRTTETGFHRL
jgi:hypothetical protein